ncbi:helix-turn-helix domain-containing protein [Metabacillus sp. RGM 3146]|uniref:helix-turn-helix domain-containing protein n=1 Tax=Metabacillus sp. RGM 3146 TaxID=3401092 RepID=UPI003B9A4C26
MNAKAKLILHPVRMRIVQTLVNGKQLTVQEMASRLPDVPQATLYRNLNKLVEGNVIEVLAENQIRGAVEKVYGLAKDAVSLSPEQFQKSSKEEQMGVFMQFAGSLIDRFGSYLEKEEVDLVKDGVSFRQIDLFMDDEEFLEFIQSIRAAYQKAAGNEPKERRKKRTVATIIIPEGESGGKNDE